MIRARKPSSCVASWLVLALVAAPGLAVAGPDAPPKDSAKAEAIGRAHFQRGQKLSTQGDYDGAYREFEAGYAATGRPLFLFNMAEAARAAGDLARAKDNYLEFLRVEPKSALAATAQARIADIDRTTGAAPPPEPTTPAAPVEPIGPPPIVPPSSAPPQSVVVTAPPATAGSPPPEEHTSIIHKWPFWAGVAGVIVAGGAIAYVATRNTNNGAPVCGAGCTTIDFQR